MTDNRLYLTTAIPYVNGAPHLGHALELVHTDTIARHHRARGVCVRVQSGTDDHALKNSTAAAAAGFDVRAFVETNAARFADLADDLGVHVDEFVRTSADPRHVACVHALWEACRARGDLYTRDYTGLYCDGCEQFYTADELCDGRCLEHPGQDVRQVTETNWFFRLSAYREQLVDLIGSGQVQVTPRERCNEILGFLAGDVQDLSVSRPATRAHGWGVPVPGDDTQVVYVWFDALANYLTGLGYGSGGADVATWWSEAGRRAHVVGKGITRFHAVYWVAFLLSAGLPTPTDVLVHDYVSVNGAKISKSGTQAVDPGALIEQFGVDAVRWWLVREPVRVGVTDFTLERLGAAHDTDLANTVGNLAARVLRLARKDAPWRVPVTAPPEHEVVVAAGRLAGQVDGAFDRYDLRGATGALVEVAAEVNRYVSARRPWLEARAADGGDRAAACRFEETIAVAVAALELIASELATFVPAGAARLQGQLDGAPLTPVFARIAAA